MTPLKQKNRHRPPVSWGDCHRTCIAMLLDLPRDEVPEYAEQANDDWPKFHGLYDMWLNARGYSSIMIPYGGDLDSILMTQRMMNPGVYYILGGVSASGFGHSVIACGGEIIADPSLTDAGIVGPYEDGTFYVQYLVPFNQTTRGKVDPDYVGLSETEAGRVTG